MIEALLEGLGVLLRWLAYQVLGTPIEKLFYWPGWLLLRLITWGRYPPPGTRAHNRFAVALFAITMGVVFWAVFSELRH